MPWSHVLERWSLDPCDTLSAHIFYFFIFIFLCSRDSYAWLEGLVCFRVCSTLKNGLYPQIYWRRRRQYGERELIAGWHHSIPRNCGDPAVVEFQCAGHHHEQMDFPGSWLCSTYVCLLFYYIGVTDLEWVISLTISFMSSEQTRCIDKHHVSISWVRWICDNKLCYCFLTSPDD